MNAQNGSMVYCKKIKKEKEIKKRKEKKRKVNQER
jgi:hypothetical protein